MNVDARHFENAIKAVKLLRDRVGEGELYPSVTLFGDGSGHFTVQKESAENTGPFLRHVFPRTFFSDLGILNSDGWSCNFNFVRDDLVIMNQSCDTCRRPF